MGWTFPWSVCAVRGTHYCLRKVDYPLIWKLLKEEGVTHFCAAPTVNTLLCSDPEAEKLKQRVKVTVAASPPSAHLFEHMTSLNLIPRHVYGLTESYGPLTVSYELEEWDALPSKERFVKIARQGHGFITSLPARVVKAGSEDEDEGQASDELVDVKRDGKEIGEIVFFGNICAKEYYKDPEATKKLFAGGGMRTGDLAVWHPDGSIQIQDRAKDIIISGRCSLRPLLAPGANQPPRRRKHLLRSPREPPVGAPVRPRGRRRRPAGRAVGRAPQGVRDGAERLRAA